ncbi:hypothetical protein LTS01_004235 [Friedmanniomyces endolithicus]|nr:hypothetical protein LTS01_004235 [Friedmanniomyces endolithicus]
MFSFDSLRNAFASNIVRTTTKANLQTARLEMQIRDAEELQGVKRKALFALEQQLRESAVVELDDEHLGRWSEAQGLAVETEKLMEERGVRREEARRVRLSGTGVFGDDRDNRVV